MIICLRNISAQLTRNEVNWKDFFVSTIFTLCRNKRTFHLVVKRLRDDEFSMKGVEYKLIDIDSLHEYVGPQMDNLISHFSKSFRRVVLMYICLF